MEVEIGAQSTSTAASYGGFGKLHHEIADDLDDLKRDIAVLEYFFKAK
jgi:hypothetical protein